MLSITKFDKTKEATSRIIDFFSKSLALVKPRDTLDLWKIVVEWCLANNYQQMETLFQKGSVFVDIDVSSYVREKYLTWCSSTAGTNSISNVRGIYEHLRQLPPFCYTFYKRYIELEQEVPKVDVKRISSAYEDALNHFGKGDLDLWLSYIQFIKTQKPSEVSNIYWRAMKHLEAPELVETFTQKFCLLQLEKLVSNECVDNAL